MSKRADEILAKMNKLSISEAGELVSLIEDAYGVSAAAPVSRMNLDAVEPEFNVLLNRVPEDKKISILKALRTLTGLGLLEVKRMVESAPVMVQERVSIDFAKKALTSLQDAGAEASIEELISSSLKKGSIARNSPEPCAEISRILKRLDDSNARIESRRVKIDTLSVETKSTLSTLHKKIGTLRGLEHVG